MKNRLIKYSALLVLVPFGVSSCAKEQSAPTFTLPSSNTPQGSTSGPTQSSQPPTTFSQAVTRQELLKRLIPSGEQFQIAVVSAGVFSSAQVLSEQALPPATDASVIDQGGWSRTWVLEDKAGARSYVTLSARAFKSATDATSAVKDVSKAAGSLTASGVHKSLNQTAPPERSVRLTASGQVSLAAGAVMLLVVWEGPSATTKVEQSIASALKEWQTGLAALTSR